MSLSRIKKENEKENMLLLGEVRVILSSNQVSAGMIESVVHHLKQNNKTPFSLPFPSHVFIVTTINPAAVC